jgi:streptogramin lyase
MSTFEGGLRVSAVRSRFLARLLCCGVGLAAFSAAAFGESTSIGGEPGTSPLGGPLLPSGGLASSQEVAAAEQAILDSPEAVRAREESTTKFAGLNAGQAATTDAQIFPGIVEQLGGGPPELPDGAKITGFLTDTAAEVELSEGQHSVIESVAPMAVEESTGDRVPVNLALRDVGSGFEPTTAATALLIPQHLGDGIELTGSGVSLTPVDQSGHTLGGSNGAADGTTVLYANTGTDLDTLIKPTAGGFDAVSVLRAADSPQEIFFGVGLPQGAELQQSPSGVAQVVQYGAVIATILPPHAQDAAGTAVPVSMAVSGTTLALKIDLHSGEYQYPVGVDPEVLGSDTQLATNGLKKSNWEFFTSNAANFASKMSTESGEYLETYGIHEYKEGEWAYWGYQTQGVSKIYEFNGETEAKNKEDRIESRVELQAPGGTTEEKELLSTELSNPEYAKRSLPEPLCPKGKGTCVSTSGTAKNAVHFEQSIVNKPTSNFGFSDFLDKGEIYISEPAGTHSTAGYNTTTSELEIELEKEGKKEKQKRANALFGTSTWLSEFGGALQFVAKDTGIGVSATRLEYESSSGKWEPLNEHNYIEEDKCKGIQCFNPEHAENWTLNTKLPNGEDKIRYRAEEAFGDATHETESPATEDVATVKVDDAKPTNIFLGGVPYGNELSEKSYELTAFATDGEGSTIASSGIKSITVYVDGKSIKPLSESEGKCAVPAGACTATAKYKIQGAELGAGHHAIVIVAKDNAGNEGREEETISIRHSTPVRLGPGSVDLQSGDFTLGSSDVSLGSGLSVSRIYSSRAVTAGAAGSVGPQWTLSVGSEETLQELVDGSVLVTSATGGQTIFAAVLNTEGKPTGKYEAPPGDSNLTMTLEENEKKEKVAYYLKAATEGTSTKFTLPSSTSKLWVPTRQEGPVATDTVSYTYQTVEVAGKKLTRPTEALAPHPNVSCSPKMEPGCRALKFTYATTTKAKGEKPTEWGEYEGRLTKVSYEGYNPATKKMTETPVPVAEYSYDKAGRLRAEWDPRISPALKTEYGYDTEGHVTALTPAGEESWVFTYAPIAGDTGTGRLLKAARAPVSAGLWNGELPANTAAPKITEATPINGIAISVSHGTWSNSPVAYSFQWEDCKTYKTAEEEEEERIFKEERKGTIKCTQIPGANNSSYAPVLTDVGYRLRVKVGALNGGGLVTIATVESLEVKAATEYASGARPDAITAGPDGNIWFADGSDIGKITPSGTKTEYPTAGGAHAITTGPDGNVWFAKSEPAEIGKITTSGAITEYSLPAGSYPVGIVTGPDKNLWFTDWKTAKVGRITTAGTITEYSLPAGSYPGGITAGPDGNLWFTIYRGEGIIGKSNEDQIAKMTTSGVITEYALPVEENQPQPSDITAGPDGNLWFTTGCGAPCYIGKMTTTGTLTRNPLLAHHPTSGITVGPDGNIWYSMSGSALGRMSTSGRYSEGPLPAESQAGNVTAGPDGNLWLADWGTNKISKVVPTPIESDPSPQPGWTMEYGIPLSGTGAPHQMGLNAETHKPEPESWGQKDDPVEGTAIVPPDSPQGWPATKYTRATAYYLDEAGRVVNMAGPSSGSYGAISTTEYNETNDVIRTLSADNRATALEAGTKSAELAKLLSTEKTYNGEGAKEKEVAEPGTKLIDMIGPQHEVKYIVGKEHKEALARNHEKFFYEDEAAEAEAKERFDLVTRSTDLAQLANEEEVEVRHTTTAYSGQKSTNAPAGLGWKLRQPTSITVDPEGAKETHTTLYYEAGSEAMGQVMETRGPAGASGNSARDSRTVYYSATENKEDATCGKHPEWAGLVCQTLPAKQPETTGLPKLAETTTTYNMWNEPETIIETFGEKTRTTQNGYDAAGRQTSGEETSTATTETIDKVLPKVTEEYNTSTGVLERQSTKVGETTKTITSKYNTLGQLEKYTDADGNVTTIKYGGPESDGLPEELTDSSDQGKSSQKYTYSEVTKRLAKLVDSGAGTFTASYDAEGKLASEVYPNGMCANYATNSVGETTHVEYLKTANCSEKEPQVWFSETKVASVHGETLSRTSTLAKEEYTYDTLGRLTEAQETPTGAFCKTRTYAYDEEANRTSLTTREPNSKKECATEGGTVEKHTYDEANRLTDAGIAYDPLGNVTTLPGADSEGHALESAFYVDNAVATQTQNGVTNNYYLDPDGRTRETVTGTKKLVTHYDGSGEAVAWTGEGSGETEKWTRNIPGIDGALTAVQKGEGKTGETAVLQLHDLEGNIVATIKDKTGETELLSSYNSTEFGVPNAGKAPPKYAWLGAGGVSSELSSGVVTEGATSYVPQTGRALQSERIPPPGLPDGSGGGAPVTFQEEPWNMEGAARVGAESPGLEAGREIEAEEAACRANPESCSEDPGWVITLSIPATEALTGALEGLEIANAVGIGKLGDLIKQYLGIDFVAQVQDAIEKGVFGFSASDAEHWAEGLGAQLEACEEWYHGKVGGKPHNAHCWIYIPTVIRKARKKGPAIAEFPNFNEHVTVAYCPVGVSYCYNIWTS